MNPTRPRCWGVVPAAGIGRRMGGDRPKQYLLLNGRPVIVHTLECLAAHPWICGLVIALAEGDPYWNQTTPDLDVPLLLAPGGSDRAASVRNALATLEASGEAVDWVLVHDAVRPCLGNAELDRLLTTLINDPVGGLLAVPVRDTLKRAADDVCVAETVDRDNLWQAQTPQMFRPGALGRALDEARRRGEVMTDEAAAIEASGVAPRLVEGCSDNLKITRPGDLLLAGRILAARERAA